MRFSLRGLGRLVLSDSVAFVPSRGFAVATFWVLVRVVLCRNRILVLACPGGVFLPFWAAAATCLRGVSLAVHRRFLPPPPLLAASVVTALAGCPCICHACALVALHGFLSYVFCVWLALPAARAVPPLRPFLPRGPFRCPLRPCALVAGPTVQWVGFCAGSAALPGSTCAICFPLSLLAIAAVLACIRGYGPIACLRQGCALPPCSMRLHLLCAALDCVLGPRPSPARPRFGAGCPHVGCGWRPICPGVLLRVPSDWSCACFGRFGRAFWRRLTLPPSSSRLPLRVYFLHWVATPIARLYMMLRHSPARVSRCMAGAAS